MNNISINKYQASLSIEELLLQESPPQQNWLLTYLDVFVLIIMLVVTLIALSDFEAEQKTKRAKTLQQYLQETTSYNEDTKSNSVPSNINHSSANDFPPLSTTINEKNEQLTSSKNISKQKNEFAALIEEKTIEYIPQALTKQQQTIITSTSKPSKEPKTKTKDPQNNKLIAELEDNNKYKNDSLNQEYKLTDNTLQKQLKKTVNELGLSGSVNMNVTRGYAQLEIQDKILFKSSESTLLGAGENLLTKLSPLLIQSSGLIYIEGHTDNRPIKTAKFPSNWELGASRATSVLHFLASKNFDKSRLRAITYADTKPIADNSTPQGREKNRRVSIVIKVSDSIN